MNEIFQFLLHKSLRAAAILIGAVLMVFLLMHVIPGSPWDNYSNTRRMMNTTMTDAAIYRTLDRHFGFDLPLWRQFTRYIIGDYEADGSFFCGVICGNLGPSTQQRGRNVEEVLFEPPKGMTFWQSRFGYSIRLIFFASLIAVGLGIPLGIFSAVSPKSAASKITAVVLAALLSIPNFVLGLLAIIVLASWLKVIKVLPDWNYPINWVVPAVVLAVMPMANISRVTRASLLNVLHEDYVRTARGKGLTERRVMLAHIIPNALVPILTFLGPTLVEMFAGLLIIENLYAFPGIGRGYWESVLKLDYPMIMGLTLVYAASIVFVNFAIEFLCEVLDPRIRSIKYKGSA